MNTFKDELRKNVQDKLSILNLQTYEEGYQRASLLEAKEMKEI
jgi:hypothetical protein